MPVLHALLFSHSVCNYIFKNISDMTVFIMLPPVIYLKFTHLRIDQFNTLLTAVNNLSISGSYTCRLQPTNCQSLLPHLVLAVAGNRRKWSDPRAAGGGYDLHFLLVEMQFLLFLSLFYQKWWQSESFGPHSNFKWSSEANLQSEINEDEIDHF